MSEKPNGKAASLPNGKPAGLSNGKAAAGKQPVSCKKKREYRIKNAMKVVDTPLYGVAFNFIDSRYQHLIATCGSNLIGVFDTSEKGALKSTKMYMDSDRMESFYTVCWSSDTAGKPLLVASGNHGVVRVIDYNDTKLRRTMIGHGGAVNEVKAHILKPWMIMSASKDESLRLWNVNTGVCILILAGISGHRNEVLSVDFHPLDETRIASCGMDGTIKIWSTKDFLPIIEKSTTWTGDPTEFPTKYVQFPLFVAESVHRNYVDCVRWLGDFLLSKSVDEEIKMWKYFQSEEGGEVTLLSQERCLQRYPAPECDIWFIKFSLDFHCTTIAIGNREGKIYLFETHSPAATHFAKLVHHKHCCSVIRQTAMSFDASIVIACCEDGTLYRWDQDEA